MRADSQFSQAVCFQGIRRIAHPTDLSPTSDNALAWAVHLAEAYDAEMLLLHVVPPPTPLFEAESPAKAQAALDLSLLLARIKLKGIAARGFVLCGTRSIDHQILKAAQREKIDVIIMGTRGRTGLSRLLVGSIASRVISRARCPVLVVPSQLNAHPYRPELDLRLGSTHG